MQLIYQHADFIVVNKPAGMSFHGQTDEAGLFSEGVVDLAARAFGYKKLWPVHRLDTMTSGLLILATHVQAAAEFGALFANRMVAKYYLALSHKTPKKKQGWIKGDMVAARRGSYKLLPSLEQPAITQFHSTSLEPGLRLFLLKPHTGKTHQLRVALKSLGSPIIGDLRYQATEVAADFDRGYLHAYGLRFLWHKDWIEICQAPGEGSLFQQANLHRQLAQWGPPWQVFESKGA
ncbi:MAG: TIGR01621 family pseudouridine synthase [Thiotrichales bacterium]|nr:TIGR01621 family pseudouridine synthase [Thiotrichales bacterium]